MASTENQDTPQGLAFAISAYFLWGFLPLYLKALSHVPAAEVVAHRILWAVPIAAAMLILRGRTRDIRIALTTPSMVLMAALCAGLISINWGIYVWAIANDRTLDAALGYYINPLFSILLGAVLLRERMRALQVVAVLLAAGAMAVLTIANGALPWPAIGLMLSWGVYALFKKSLPVGPNQGFLLEVLLLTPPALGYVLWLGANGNGFFLVGLSDTALLVGAGAVTAIPLMLYANGAKLLRLSTIAILQYIAPTMIMLVGVFVFKEPFGGARMIAFPMIWGALVLYSVSLFRQMRGR